jgi:YgiT-type zinc finger domain-containing protein
MNTGNEEQGPERSEYILPCPECRSGVMRLQYITYFTWLNEELVTVPNFPAWVCDMCGRRDYDNRAVSWLNTLLNPLTGKRRPNHRRQRPSRADRLQP